MASEITASICDRLASQCEPLVFVINLHGKLCDFETICRSMADAVNFARLAGTAQVLATAVTHDVDMIALMHAAKVVLDDLNISGEKLHLTVRQISEFKGLDVHVFTVTAEKA